MLDTLIINPMTNALLLLYAFLGDIIQGGAGFVLAIAVFTVLIRLLTLPLSLRQQKSSLQMQEMQPEIQRIQKKYKDNPQKMQEEFKKIGYNPMQTLTGCLPLLIQFPILIGFYQAIRTLLGSTPLSLFELTGRISLWVDQIVDTASILPIPNKFLWLNLSQPDPFYVLPVLVFVSMFVQQKLMMPAKKKDEDKKGKKQQEDNPMAGMSQSMQWTMPIMFGFFALSFPAGLSIYFILSNVIGIGQGYMTRSNLAKEKAARASREEIVTTGIPATVENPRRSSASNGQPKRRKKGTKPKRKRRSAKR